MSTYEDLVASGFNETLLNNPALCTTKTCPVELQTMQYVPSLPGNAFFLALFALLLIAHLAFGFKWRTWSFAGCVFGGLVLEIIGYVARIQMHNNPFDSDPFLMLVPILHVPTVPPTLACSARRRGENRHC